MCLGVPAKVVKILPQSMAVVDVQGNLVEISVRFTPEVRENDYVLVHAGFAMEIIDPEWAEETTRILEELHGHAEY
ncbi:MAG: HypC/HybG/HupF family hydrogenase formation chaperone [Firmicutes bacterium]|nr:HypC/HybG/HupF family hydrogenase formation chaperone [Bacillota bacterium]